MEIFNQETKSKLTEILKQMNDKVNIIFFTQEFECNTCRDARAFIYEFAGMSDKIAVTEFEITGNMEKAGFLKVDKVPCFAFLDSKDNFTGIKFYGVPGGYEINSFVKALIEVSGIREPLPDDILKRIKAVNREIHIQVFVSLMCPYCPAAVSTAHRIALENSNIHADMVDTAIYPHLAGKYSVTSVPKMVINETSEILGAKSAEEIIKAIEDLK